MPKKNIIKLETAIKQNVKRKNQLKSDMVRKKISRKENKEKVATLMEENPEIAEKLKCLTSSDKLGRPVYERNDELLHVIKEIAIVGSGADDHRSSELIRTVRSLDDLTTELNKKGFLLKRSAMYIRLVPKRCGSLHGKTHVTTVPVKLIRASNDKRAKNPDRYYAAMIMQHTEEIASLLGNQYVIYMGKDDKAHVPIGITAANKQAPLLMSLKYRVSLPDHDFAVATSIS